MTVAVTVAGANGRMGQAVAEAVFAAPGLSLAHLTVAPGSQPREPLWAPRECYGDDLDAALAASQVLVDFTAPGVVAANAAACRRRGCAWVLGTTGLDTDQQAAVHAAANDIAICQAANFSRGVTLLLGLLEQVAAVLGDDTDVEIVEAHHRDKRDAPSGTALAMGDAVARGRGVLLDDVRRIPVEGIGAPRARGAIGFASVRGGDIVGEHTALFAGDGERLEITHRAGSRRAFANGACRAAQWLVGRAPGIYNMQDVLGLRNEDR